MPRTVPAPATPAEVEALNDRLAREHPIDDYYARSPGVVRFVEQRRLALIERLLAVRAGERLLEVGSGGGHVLQRFPQATLTAVDVSDVYLETARRNLQGYTVEFLKGELPALGLPAGSFDAAICTEVLEHIADPTPVLRELARVLHPTHGRAVITVPVDPLIDGLKRVVRRTPVGWALGDRVAWGGDEYHLHRWWPWQFRRLLEPHFAVVAQAAAPASFLPLRACFLVRPHPAR